MQQLKTDKLQPIELPQLPENPLVSVLVANYNYARYISETLESILSQTYQNFEVIVCDDGSKDNSCEIIETYVQKDSRIKLISKENGGVATALNTTYRESKGEIICLLDADDIWLNTKLEKVVENFKSNAKNGFVIHNVLKIDGVGKLIKSTPMYKRLASGWMAQSALDNGGFVYNIPPASALSVRREIADLIFPLNEEFKRNADSIIFRIAPFVTVIGSVTEALSKFRLHGANTTSASTLTVDVMEGEQDTLARIHQEQKQFLTNHYNAEIAQQLQDWRCSLTVRRNLYLIARLKKLPKYECSKAHKQLVNHPYFQTEFKNSILQKLLLEWGGYFPSPIFTELFNQVYGWTWLKRFSKLVLK